MENVEINFKHVLKLIEAHAMTVGVLFLSPWLEHQLLLTKNRASVLGSCLQIKS